MASDYTITEVDLLNLFTENENVRYVIPKYQRHYIWKKENWEDFYSDLTQNERHFLGSIILINKERNSRNPNLQIIDGQQRITTLSLLYAAIFERLNNINKESIPEKEKKFYDYYLVNLEKVLKIDKSEKLRLELSLTKQNNDDYCEIMNLIGLWESQNQSQTRFKTRRLYSAFQFFKDKLNDCEFTNIRQILDTVFTGKLISIEVGSNSDAFLLFESLNNRGEPLSATDLIKTKMFSELIDKLILDEDSAFKNWEKLIENIDDYKLQEKFLIHYYNAFKYKSEIFESTKATKTNLITHYEKLN